VSTIAGPAAGNTAAGSGDGVVGVGFNSPRGLTIDSQGNLYVAEYAGNKIRRINNMGVVVTTLAGSGIAGVTDGIGSGASFWAPFGMTVDNLTGNMYVAERDGNKIRKITPTGVVTTFAGPVSGITTPGSSDGTGTSATFTTPCYVVVDASGNVYVSDTGNNKIRKITPAGVVTSFAGPPSGSSTSGFSDGTGTAALFSAPNGIAVDSSGNVYVADTGNNKIRKITPSGSVTTIGWCEIKIRWR
jgi:streptogramin lyase